MRLALPTDGEKGLKDRVCEVFSKAPKITIIDWDGQSHLVEVADNPAINMSQGAGPVATKILKEKRVDVLICGPIGIGVSTILSGYKIQHIRVEPGVKLTEAVAQIETLWNI